MQDIKNILTILPNIYMYIKSIEKYPQQNNLSQNHIKEIFNDLPDKYIESFEKQFLNDSNIKNTMSNFTNLILMNIFSQSFEHLKSIYSNPNVNFAQINDEEIKLFLSVVKKLNINTTTYALLLIFLSEICRTSEPVTSFELIMQAFTIQPDLGKFLKIQHLENIVYNSEIAQYQTKFEKCLICGGEGIPFHNAPSYRMEGYNTYFLPSKLWMKCVQCNNLYTQYFPSKFLNRNNQLKFITPQPNTTYKLNNISSYVLKTWRDILKHIKQYTDGENILEIGVGRGDLVSVALEMNYDIECIEIEEDVA